MQRFFAWSRRILPSMMAHRAGEDNLLCLDVTCQQCQPVLEVLWHMLTRLNHSCGRDLVEVWQHRFHSRRLFIPCLPHRLPFQMHFHPPSPVLQLASRPLPLQQLPSQLQLQCSSQNAPAVSKASFSDDAHLSTPCSHHSSLHCKLPRPILARTAVVLGLHSR